jgi:hypothetical protein
MMLQNHVEDSQLSIADIFFLRLMFGSSIVRSKITTLSAASFYGRICMRPPTHSFTST